MGIKTRNSKIRKLAVRCAGLRRYTIARACNESGTSLPDHTQEQATRRWYTLWYTKSFGLPELQAEVGRLMREAGCAVPR